MSGLLKVLNNPKYQALLKALRDGKLDVVEPLVSFESGVEYPKMKEFFDSESEAREALDALVEADILAPEVVDNVMVCPRCQTHKLMLRALCPACSSPKLSRSAMIEHVSCGHMDFEERFRSELGMICPRCGRPLGEADYRVLSKLYRCLDCKRVFSEPRTEYLCSKGHRLSGASLAFQGVSAYKLSPEKRALLEYAILDVEELVKPLREEGLEVEARALVVGRSGLAHEFSFVVWGNARASGEGENRSPMVVGSVHTSERVTASDVLALHAKAFDVGAGAKLIVTKGVVDGEARELAKVYDIEMVESRNPKELAEKVKERVLKAVRRGSASRA